MFNRWSELSYSNHVHLYDIDSEESSAQEYRDRAAIDNENTDGRVE